MVTIASMHIGLFWLAPNNSGMLCFALVIDMPTYRIHRMKESPRQSFRWAAHTAGAASVKPREYEPDAGVDAASPYAAWSLLAGSERPLQVGDLLEEPGGSLHICKYVGFEEARWVLPEVKTGLENAPLAAGSEPGGAAGIA